MRSQKLRGWLSDAIGNSVNRNDTVNMKARQGKNSRNKKFFLDLIYLRTLIDPPSP
jgi:hypothetical protein